MKNIEIKIIEHKINLENKYNSLEFKNLSHIQKIDIMISDSIIKNIYEGV
jgi:hypothetical protein